MLFFLLFTFPSFLESSKGLTSFLVFQICLLFVECFIIKMTCLEEGEGGEEGERQDTKGKEDQNFNIPSENLRKRR